MVKRDHIIKKHYTAEARKKMDETALWNNIVPPLNKERIQFLPFVENSFSITTKPTYALIKQDLTHFMRAYRTILTDETNEEETETLDMIEELNSWIELLDEARPVSNINFDNGFLEHPATLFAKNALLQETIDIYKTPIEDLKKNINSNAFENKGKYLAQFFADTSFLQNLVNHLEEFEKYFMQSTDTRFVDFHKKNNNSKAELFETWKYDWFIYINKKGASKSSYDLTPNAEPVTTRNGSTLTEISLLDKSDRKNTELIAHDAYSPIAIMNRHYATQGKKNTVKVEDLFIEQNTINRYQYAMQLKKKLQDAEPLTPETQHLIETIFITQLPESLSHIESVSYMKDERKIEIEKMFLNMLEKSISKLEEALEAHENEILEKMSTYFTAHENVIEQL